MNNSMSLTAERPKSAQATVPAKLLATVRKTPASGAPRSHRIIAVIATLGALLFGYDTGVISGALPYMQHPIAHGGLGLTNFQEGLIGFYLLIGAAVGSLMGGRLSDRIGRRHCIILLAVIFLFGALGNAFAPNIWIMYPFRFILGLAVGGASTTVPVYLAEVAPRRLRGTLVAVDQLMIVVGQMAAFSVNAIIANTIDSPVAWRYMLFVCSIPAVFLWIGMYFMPESARWLSSRGRLLESIGALKRMRECGDEEIAEEIHEISDLNIEAKMAAKGGWKDLKQKWIRTVVLIGIGIALLQQTTGINTLMYYAPKILMITGQSETAAITAQVANGVISVIGSACGLWLILKLRRRQMLITGLIGIVISLLLISVIFWTQVQPYLLPDGSVDPHNAPPAASAFIVLGAMLVFLFFNQGFQAPANWVLLSEIFPQKMRGFGMGMAVFCLWTINAIITWVFPMMITHFGGGLTFGFFVVINLLTITFAHFFVPETKHLSLEELEEQLEKEYS